MANGERREERVSPGFASWAELSVGTRPKGVVSKFRRRTFKALPVRVSLNCGRLLSVLYENLGRKSGFQVSPKSRDVFVKGAKRIPKSIRVGLGLRLCVLAKM